MRYSVILKNMTDSIAHRGPDGEGHWIEGNGFGHRRLSIIDLSPAGHQPMIMLIIDGFLITEKSITTENYALNSKPMVFGSAVRLIAKLFFTLLLAGEQMHCSNLMVCLLWHCGIVRKDLCFSS